MEDVYFDKEGDVRFIVTTRDEQQVEKQLGYVVNSAILRLASPVFATLFSAKFAEGTRLRQRSANDAPIDIPLSEDDANAMKLLLDMLHMIVVPTTLTLERLIGLAAVVHKYQCARPCRDRVESWMIRNIELADRPWTPAFPEYLGLGMLFESDRIYHMAAVGLALTSTISETKGSLRGPATSVRERVSGVKSVDLKGSHHITMIEQARRDCCIDFRDQCVRVVSSLSSLIAQYSLDGDGEVELGDCDSHHAEKLLAIYYTNLAYHDILTEPKAAPLTIMSCVCEIAKAIKAASPPTRVQACDACDLTSAIEDKMYRILRNVLNSDRGPHLDISSGAQVGPRKDVFWGGTSMQTTELFGAVLGHGLLEGGWRVSFERLFMQVQNEYATLN